LVVEGVTPAIDSSVFPDTPGFEFWSSTADSSGGYWVVNFSDGSRDNRSQFGLTANVRCVRFAT
jgi:hypothetical protein